MVSLTLRGIPKRHGKHSYPSGVSKVQFLSPV
jgi:hypothetical protein